jgi:hypothetical protein
MNKRFILTEEDKNEIVSLYSQKNIVLEQAAEKPITVQDIQNKLVQLGYGNMLGKFGADGKFGKMTYSAITQAIDFIEKRNASKSSEAANAAGSIQGRDTGLVPTTSTADKGIKISTVSALAQMNKDITTPEQAQSAIEAAKAEANKRAEEERQAAKLGRQIARRTKEMCSTVGMAVNPIIPFKKGVATQELCDALRGCISDGLIVRDETVFTACNAFPAKQTTPTTGSTQTTNTTTV